MAAVSKSESLLYKDARLYCARKHMNTLWKTMRVDRRFDVLLEKKLYHLEKSRSYRAREIDQGQEQFLEELTKIFERQCEIAADKLENEIGDSLLKSQHDSAQARLRGSRRKSMRRMRSFTVPIHNVLQDSEVHVVPGCEHERPPPKQSTLGEDFRLSSAQSFGRQSRENFVRSFEDQIDGGRASACCNGESAELRVGLVENAGAIRGKQADDQRSQQTPSRLRIHESVSIQPQRQPPARKTSGITRPGTGSMKHAPGSRPDTATDHSSTWTASKRYNMKDFRSQPVSAKRTRCKKCEPTIAWEIVPRHKSTRVPTSSKLQSTVFNPGNRDKAATDEETLFRKQFLACAMSRFLPISALQGSSFGEHDDVRKKMEGRRRCLEELKQQRRAQIQTAPPAPTRGFMASKSSNAAETTTRASSMTASSMNMMNATTPGSTHLLDF